MRRGTILLATTALGLATPLSALAQTAPSQPGAETPGGVTTPGANVAAGQTQTDAPTSADEDAETIVVTGTRASLRSSQNLKRVSPQLIDAVVAEDIGKLPDRTVSETAARLPGVQVYRQGGEVSTVTVRGLDRPLYTTTYNGREIFTAEIRTVALQDFPSPNIAALEAIKTSTADLVEPGLAGTVNVRSRKPFDFRDGQIAGQAYALFGRQSEQWRPNGDILLTKRWDTGLGEMGLLVNASYTELRYLDGEPSNTDFLATPTVNGQQVRFPDIQRLFYRAGNRTRPSANAAFQWAPSEQLEIYAEALWQGFRNRIDDRLLAAPLFGAGPYSNIVLRPGTNLVSSGTVVGPPGSLFTFQGATFNKTDTFQYAGGAKFKSDRVRASVDVARTTSTFRGSTESLDRNFIGSPTVNFDNEAPTFDIGGISFEPGNATFGGLFEQNQRSAGRGWQARGDLTWEIDSGPLDNLQLGIRWTEREAKRDFADRFGNLNGLGLSATLLPVNFSEFTGIGETTPDSFASPDYGSVRSNLTELRQFVAAQCALAGRLDGGCGSYIATNGEPVPLQRLYRADEDTLAGYAQVNVVAGDRVDGVIGVRIVRTQTRVRGPLPSEAAGLDEGSDDVDVLGNASFRWRPAEPLQLRLAASQTRTLPQFADLNPRVIIDRPDPTQPVVGTPERPRTGSGGNPFLNPFTSLNFDASVEYYFARAGYAAASVFYRDIDGFILPQTFRFTDPTLGVVQISGPVNGGRGEIQGFEISGQGFADFDWLPEWARGFGLQANLTYLNARSEQPGREGRPRITGFENGISEWNWNLIGIYERDWVSARLTYNGRTEYPAVFQNRGDDLYFETGRPADRLDLSLNFNIGRHLTIFGDWTNITKDPFEQDFSSARGGAPRAEYIRYQRYDESTISAGVRFRFGE